MIVEASISFLDNLSGCHAIIPEASPDFIRLIISSIEIKNDSEKSDFLATSQNTKKEDVGKKNQIQVPDNKILDFENQKNADIQKKYRYADDPVFNIKEFSGLVNEDNVYARDELFSRKDYELAAKQMTREDYNFEESAVEQFENQIDYSLGIDFPEEKRKNIRSAQREMFVKKKVISKLFSEGKITDETFRRLSGSILTESLDKASNCLTDEEYKALFQHEKSAKDKVYKSLINLPRAF